jgi:hypothetical protein
MRFLTIILFAFLNINSTVEFHDAVTAKFHVVERGEVLFLEIEFEEENLIKLNKTSSLRVTKEDFTKYLNETTSWVFNGKELHPKTLSIQATGHHKKAICFLSKSIKNVKSVQVKNEFLLDIEEHINVVMLDVNQTYKDYKLDKKRKEISVSYNK